MFVHKFCIVKDCPAWRCQVPKSQVGSGTWQDPMLKKQRFKGEAPCVDWTVVLTGPLLTSWLVLTVDQPSQVPVTADTLFTCCCCSAPHFSISFFTSQCKIGYGSGIAKKIVSGIRHPSDTEADMDARKPVQLIDRPTLSRNTTLATLAFAQKLKRDDSRLKPTFQASAAVPIFHIID